MTGPAVDADFRDLFDTAPCGYVILRGGRIVLANATLAAWLGRDAGSLQGAPLRDILTTAARVLFETNLSPLLHLRGRIEEVSLDLRGRDGARIPVLLAANVADGGRIRMAFHKAAARQQYERDLITARKGAEQNLIVELREGELREQFVAVLGHDLRNPLASIAAATRLLRRETLSEPGAEVLTLMQGSTQRMSQMIDNVLDFARGRLGGGIGLSRSDAATLGPLISQVAEELRSSVPGAEILVEVDAPHPLRLDPGRIGQMMSNLIGNALTHGDLSHPVLIAAQTFADGSCKICVSNRGTPIPPGAIARLFDPFVRGESESYRDGLGLGLHIASEIAKAHGGTLSVLSTEAETRFTFAMPAS